MGETIIERRRQKNEGKGRKVKGLEGSTEKGTKEGRREGKKKGEFGDG